MANQSSNLETLKVKDLRELCKKRGLVQSGNKKQLINKIKTQSIGFKFKKPETFGEIADKNQRGKLRGCFESIFKPQLGDKCKLIFNGHISDL